VDCVADISGILTVSVFKVKAIGRSSNTEGEATRSKDLQNVGNTSTSTWFHHPKTGSALVLELFKKTIIQSNV
jgi:hypothetical protein